MISDGTPGWAVTPSGIAEIIKSISFFGYVPNNLLKEVINKSAEYSILVLFYNCS
jgi:hypothetical protein